MTRYIALEDIPEDFSEGEPLYLTVVGDDVRIGTSLLNFFSTPQEREMYKDKGIIPQSSSFQPVEE
tara:strand:- start:425 stop:622 length:198 start_codon:yes stop_codon:yes gene_type:complete